MNILLLDGLPEDYEGIPLSPDFRNMIQVDLILRDPDMSDTEKTIACLMQLYPDVPGDISKAIQGLEWFFSRGQSKDTSSAGQGKMGDRAFDFNQDANLIYAAFYSSYGINLATVDFLHWWEFMALFEGLPAETLIKRVMYWRTADLADVSKYEEAYILKMRELFELKDAGRKPMNIDELNRQTKERVARRFAQARAAVEKEKNGENC